MYKAEARKIEIAHKRIDIVRDSLKAAKADLIEAKYFSLENNADAQEYFNYKTLDKDIVRIKEEVLALNHQEDGNPLVPYGKINGEKCIVNKIEVLNHRWLIAEFYAGDLRGEVLVKYFFNPEKPTTFDSIETVLYNKK
ncbi:hydrolase [Myroides pelagicus]|nr:hydrolase [Myroides pelagicus]MEC4113789.1 hydrolase [Myroides pelagicus]